VPLTGAQEVPPVTTSASGTSCTAIAGEGRRQRVDRALGHATHRGAARGLQVGPLYVNVDSNAHQGGEIRAQLKP
jgi:hypothetical protein